MKLTKEERAEYAAWRIRANAAMDKYINSLLPDPDGTVEWIPDNPDEPVELID